MRFGMFPKPILASCHSPSRAKNGLRHRAECQPVRKASDSEKSKRYNANGLSENLLSTSPARKNHSFLKATVFASVSAAIFYGTSLQGSWGEHFTICEKKFTVRPTLKKILIESIWWKIVYDFQILLYI